MNRSIPAEPLASETAMTVDETVLGVEQSLTGRRWRQRPVDERAVQTLVQQGDVSEISARVLVSRGIGIDQVGSFLNPTLRELLPNPSKFRDVPRAAERLAGAIMQDECIGVFGDYDVDGATSSALISRFVHAVGGRVAAHIPDRIKEGYGPNAPALLALKDRDGASVIVTVDCGTLSFEPLAAAHEAGIDVIVVDHHTAEPTLPKAIAVINPNRLDESGDCGYLAAVGVAFLLVVAVNRVLREAGWYGASRPEPDLLQWLDLVALGTVCDVVPLVGVNRALVIQGLKVMASRQSLGMRALADVAGIDEAPTAYHLGFVMGPRVNAGGRVGEADLGYRMLTTEHEDEAWHLARKLDGFNRDRQAIEAEVLEAALRQLEDEVGAVQNPAPPAISRTTPSSATGSLDALALAHGDGWHPGVIGIVASRVKERFNRPACVVSWDGNRGVGSGRSIKGIDLGAAIIAARQAGLLEKGGGHAMAAGFTVMRDRFAAFQEFMNERVAAGVEEAGITASLYLDGAMRPDAVSIQLAEELAMLGPFGSGNPEPRFVLPDTRLAFADLVGERHVKCRLALEGKGALDGIAFRALDSNLGQALLEHDGRRFHLAGRLRLNTWNGRTSAQFQIEDGCIASG